MSEWQPIVTAPMDGTRFLAYLPSEPVGFEDWCITDCWYSDYTSQLETPYCSGVNPTHWMPLPEPPK